MKTWIWHRTRYQLLLLTLHKDGRLLEIELTWNGM
jgi:hypothetical protein